MRGIVSSGLISFMSCFVCRAWLAQCWSSGKNVEPSSRADEVIMKFGSQSFLSTVNGKQALQLSFQQHSVMPPESAFIQILERSARCNLFLNANIPLTCDLCSFPRHSDQLNASKHCHRRLQSAEPSSSDLPRTCADAIKTSLLKKPNKRLHQVSLEANTTSPVYVFDDEKRHHNKQQEAAWDGEICYIWKQTSGRQDVASLSHSVLRSLTVLSGALRLSRPAVFI